MQISQLPYSPGLDGLRALAVVAVMVYHANHTWLRGGFLGVEVFFVISGYLITLLLIAEHERQGSIRLGQFWIRRARRLLPALFVMLVALAVYMTLFNRRPLGRTRGDFLGGLFYGSNWYQIAVGQGYTDIEAFAPLRHLWSLAVEEQFYLVWPLVMVVLLRKGRDRLPQIATRLVLVALGIAIAVAVLYVPGDVEVECGTGSRNGYATIVGRCINVNDALYLSTFTRASGLLLGAAFAMIWRPVALMRGPMRRKGHHLDAIAVLALALLGVMMWRLGLSGEGERFGSRFDPWLYRGGFFVVGLVTLVVIAAVVHRQALLGRVLGNPLFHWIGTRSYGLYLFHWPIYQIIRTSSFDMSVWQFVAAMVITVPVTEACFRFVETPIRRHGLMGWRTEGRRPAASLYRRRRRLMLAVAATSSVLGFAGMSLAVAENECVGAVECSVENNPQIALPPPTSIVDPTTAPPPSVDPGSTTTTSVAAAVSTAATVPVPVDPAAPPVETAETVATTAVPDTTAAPVTEPAPTQAPIALGESVMLGAISQLQSGGFYVDALKSRQGTEMAELVEGLRAMNQIGRTVVIQIGTNGSVDQSTFDRIMAQLPPETTPQVVFLTVTAPRGWTDGNNAIIRNLPSIYPNVTVLDWQAAVAGGVRLCPDGIHIVCGTGAQQAYANLIFEAVGRPELSR
jgi:peptidoglycan/LPS O-acetylase OafA/YrhL